MDTLYKYLFLGLVLAIGFALDASAQVNIDYQPQVESLKTQYLQEGQMESKVNGYRIQLVASIDRKSVDRALGRFRALYPTISADWKHESPYYRLHAGAYEDKWEAVRMLYVVKREYPSAFIIQDSNIRESELIN